MSRVAIITLSSLLLVGLVGAVTFGFVTNWGKDEKQKLASNSKAVQAICNPTDYKDACIKSLADVRTDDPKELVKAAFASAKSELMEVANNSTTLKELEKNPKTAQAVRDCKELFQDAIDDFQRSFDKIGMFEWDQVNNMLSDLKTWLSATRTYQETCLYGFENTTGDASVKVQKVLQTAMQMSSNGLAIVNDLSQLFTNLDISTFNRRRLLSQKTTFNRRLLGDDDNGSKNDVLLQDSEEDRRRKLLSSSKINGHSNSELFLPEWVDGFRRRLLEATSLVEDLKTKANVVVAQDGSGKYKTIEEALKDIPKNGNESFVIYIKEGVYNEYLVLFKWMTNVVFIGDGPTKTRITNNKNFADGTKTFKTATLSVLGDFFMAKDIGVENTAGAIKHQAVAFRAQSDKSIFYNCHFDGYQDTLYTHTYRQFYRDCKISGTIDFIFGDATAFFQNCTFVVRKPLENQNCIVTAQGRMERHQPTGIFIHKSRFEAASDYYPVKDKNKAYLGRPWKEYSKTIIMESEIGDFIQPDGWLPWEGTFGLDTSYYGEYNNAGPGSSLTNRVKWRGIKTIVHDRAEKFMPPTLYENDDWIKASGIPYEPTLSGAAGPMSGFDEDPNAPAGAPSSYLYDDSSSSGSVGGSSGSGSSSGTSSSTSHGSSGGSSSSKSSPSTSHTSSSSSGNGSGSGSGSGNGSGSSSSDSPTKKTSSGSSTSGGGSSSSSSANEGAQSSGDGSSSSSTEGAQSSGDNSSSSSTKGAQSSEGTSSSSSSSSTSSSTTSSSSSSTSPSTTTTTGSTNVADAPTSAPAPSPLSEAELTTPSPTPTTTTSSLDLPPTTTQNTSPTNLPSTATTQQTSPTNPTSSPTSSSPTTLKAKATLHVGPIKMRELERILMANEEMQGEDDAGNDDMSGNVPDGDEPSPARVEAPTPTPSSTTISPTSQGPSPANGPSSDEEVSDWIPPATAPGPADEEEADKVPPASPPPPKPSSGSNTKFELHVILSGMFMWAALFM